MVGTYASFLLILGFSALLGQAVFAACGRRSMSRLSPAVGLAVLTAVAWGTARISPEGVISLTVIAVLGVASAAFLRGRLHDLPRALRIAVPVELIAVVVASLPFIVERRFGILGTGLNPDMSQHLLATDRLVHGEGGRLLDQGYPLGPHSLVAALSKLGPSTVQAFDGLMLAVAVMACLAALALIWQLPEPWRLAGALLVGLPYLVASYLIQGAFKETIEALFVLAFAIGLHQLSRGELTAASTASAWRALPLAVLVIGAVYCYSFPGLLWLAAAAGLWALLELGLFVRRESLAAAVAVARQAAPATGAAIAVLVLASLPELGRMIDFASFETFNPSGAGFGNLFNAISPLEALGIWPSGDFRLDPGDGAMPAAGFYVGELLGLAALAYGLAWWLKRGERAVPSALAAAVALFAFAHFAGTPYQAAKATVMAAPLAMLIAARALLSTEPLVDLGGVRGAAARRRGGAAGVLARNQSQLRAALAVAFLGAAAGSSVLALVNGPVGPSTYSPALTQLRPLLGTGSTLVLTSEHVLADEHGRDYLVWELRGGRVCVAAQQARNDAAPAGGHRSSPPPGVAHVVTGEQPTAPFAGFRLERRAGPYALWARHPLPKGHGPCRLISVGGRANPAAG